VEVGHDARSTPTTRRIEMTTAARTADPREEGTGGTGGGGKAGRSRTLDLGDLQPQAEPEEGGTGGAGGGGKQPGDRDRELTPEEVESASGVAR
jgi:hypothetical protein